MVVKNNAEFGVELALAVPYAYWLHEQGQLDTVITSKGMKPFYYFCDDVREEFTHRTIDNAQAGLNDLPNNWIHGDTKAETVMTKPGVLDYSQWKLPPYKDYYNDKSFTSPTVFVTNVFNHPDNSDVRHYHHFTIQNLYEIFNALSEKGYDVIYKRERNENKEITYDQNERPSIQTQNDILAEVEGYGSMTDFDLVNHFDNVYLFEDKVKELSLSYNESQLKILANCDKYISVCGGNGILSSCFGGTTVIYVTQGRELRPNYFGKEGYFHQLSKSKILPVIDLVKDIKERGYHDVSDIIKIIEKEF
tara:strand:+ start:4391 stop:5308 length:918 start_codon:yes stop_codon:yes gene_type:complete